MTTTRTILVAVEDAETRAFLAENLTADGYAVVPADDKSSALARIAAKAPDLVVCDVNGDTLGVLDAVRNADGLASRIRPDVPLIVLTGQVDALARVRYLDHGSDDVVCKPFSYPELLARVRAVLHRAYARPAGCSLTAGPLRLDPVSREVYVHGERVELSNKEYALLRALATEPTRVWTKAELLKSVWGYRSLGITRTLDSHACRLRQKLSIHGSRLVINVWGVGYRLIDGPTLAETSAASPISAAGAPSF
jgi:DNA-binding response OmpR family regulator